MVNHIITMISNIQTVTHTRIQTCPHTSSTPVQAGMRVHLTITDPRIHGETIYIVFCVSVPAEPKNAVFVTILMKIDMYLDAETGQHLSNRHSWGGYGSVSSLWMDHYVELPSFKLNASSATEMVF